MTSPSTNVLADTLAALRLRFLLKAAGSIFIVAAWAVMIWVDWAMAAALFTLLVGATLAARGAGGAN